MQSLRFVLVPGGFYLFVLLVRYEFAELQTLEPYLSSWQSVPIIVCAFLIYLWGYQKCAEQSMSVLLLGACVLGLELVATPVLFSSDVFLYVMQGRIISKYGENPYYVTPHTYPKDAAYAHVFEGWRGLPQTYGPLWALCSAGISSLAINQLYLSVILFKFAGFLGHLLLGVLLFLIAKTLSIEKCRSIVYLYLWNPFLLVEFCNNGHNDVWMIVAGIAAYYFLLRGKGILTLPLLTLAALIKYTFIVLLPVFIARFYFKKEISTATLAVSGLFSLLIAFVAIWPWYRGAEVFYGIFSILDENSKYLSFISPLRLVFILCAKLYTWMFVADSPDFLWSPTVIRVIAALVLVAAFLYALFRKLELERTVVLLLQVLVLFTLVFVLPWYISWWIPFLLLAQRFESTFFWTAVALCAYPLGYSVAFSFVFLMPVYLLICRSRENHATKMSKAVD